MKPDLQPSPPALPDHARRLFAVFSVPLLLAWGCGIVHPVLDWASVPGAMLAGLPAALGPIGFLGVLLGTGAFIATRADAHPRIHRGVKTTLHAGGAVAALAVVASGAAANRPGSWLPVLLAVGLVSRRRTESVDAWRVPTLATPAVVILLWIAAMRIRPWGDGLLPTAAEDALSSLTDATLIAALPLLPLIPIAVVAALLARRAAPRTRGALLGVAVALVLEKTFGFGENWISMAALGALFGAWPPDFSASATRGRPLVLATAPLVVGLVLAGARLGLVERWNCTAGSEAAKLNPEYEWLTTESDGVSMAVLPSENAEAIVVLRRDGRLERFTGRVLSAQTEVEPGGGLLVTPPSADMPLLRLVGLPDGLRVEWWDHARLTMTAAREVDVGCEPVSGTIESDTLRVWAVCEADDRMVLVGPDDAPPQIWDVADAPRHVRITSEALFAFFGGPAARARIHRIPRLDDEVADHRTGPWAEGMTSSDRRAAVGRGPAGHVEVFGQPPRATDEAPSSYADVLADAFGHRADTVRVGTWPGVPFWTLVGEPHDPVTKKGRGWYESLIVTSPVDARVTFVDLDVLWHQRSVPIGAPIRSIWVDDSTGTLFGMNRCGVFSLRLRTTFPWDPPVGTPPKKQKPDATPEKK